MNQFSYILNAKSGLRSFFVVVIFGVVALVFAATALMQDRAPQETTPAFWQEVPKDVASAIDLPVEIDTKEYRAFTLDAEAMRVKLASAPMEFTSDAIDNRLILSLPAPDKGFQRFAVQESPVMEPGLAALHPEIRTYSGTGIDDPGATIRLDQTRLGFHASIRGSSGSWYIDPRFHLDQSLYISYFRRDLVNRHGPLVENEVIESIEAEENFKGDSAPADLAVGDQLRTYRLALLTDPTYATYFGGPANVTSAKVTLVNRITQIYEYDLSIRLVLIANNDLLNLNTAAQFSGPNGPCGGNACYFSSTISCSGSTLFRTREVIGLLVGASAFDVGHIAVGSNGGGIASLAVVGGNLKAQGCTGLETPVGDYFAVDYVAHEIGHQFGANHTFNGTGGSCSGGNRSAANSVEPGSGSSIMAYAGICGPDNSQPHSDPYFSQRSFDAIISFSSFSEANLSEVQMAALTGFNTNGQSFQLQYNGNTSGPIVRGTNYTTAGIKAAIEAIPGWPSGGTVAVSGLTDNAFTVTFGNTLAGINTNQLLLVNCTGGCSGFVGEITKGGTTTRGGAVTANGNTIPTITAPASLTIPLRTPFSLTATGFDADGDTLTYLWEQTDRGAATGTALFNNIKLNGPLFRQFGIAANVTPANALLYNSPGQNLVTTDPTRFFPDLNQILANQTNAETGSCPQSDIICFSEFLPTAAYVGFAGVNASPLSLNFRVTVRDGNGGVNSANTTLLIDNTAGPLLVTSQGTPVTYSAGTVQNVTWAVNNTAGPSLAPNVMISLSTDGGNTYPYVLAASTPNDGSEAVTLPNVGTTTARIKVEAVGNVFFDLNATNFSITGPTAASVSVAGRVSTADGNGLRNAGILLTDSQGVGRQALSNSFGYYRFDNVSVGETYFVTVKAKSYQFAPQVVTITEDIFGLDFIAQ